MGALLTIKDLHVSFLMQKSEIHVVRGISLSLEQGEVLAIVGESGCGKSVTAKSIMRLDIQSQNRKTTGSVILDHKDIYKLSGREMAAVRGTVASMIFQDPMSSLNPTMRIGEQLTEMMRLRTGLSARRCREEAVRLLEMVHIQQPHIRARQYPHQLSGGMLQRVMIAMALAGNPKLLIADEPTTALDATIQKEILKLLLSLRQELGMAMILITHDLSVAANTADRIAVMYAGKIVETGPILSVLTSPRHPYTKALLNSLPAMVPPDAPLLYSIPGAPPDMRFLPPGCPFAPRCELAVEACTDCMPPEIAVSPVHRAACIMAADSM